MPDASAWFRPLLEKERTTLAKRVRSVATTDALAPETITTIIAARSSTLPRKQLEALGTWWMQVVDATTSWRLHAWAWKSGYRPMVVAPNGDFAIDGAHLLVLGTVSTHELTEQSPLELYRALQAPLPDALRLRYMGCGVLKPSAHLERRAE
jgi:hypothetical protein